MEDVRSNHQEVIHLDRVGGAGSITSENSFDSDEVYRQSKQWKFIILNFLRDHYVKIIIYLLLVIFLFLFLLIIILIVENKTISEYSEKFQVIKNLTKLQSDEIERLKTQLSLNKSKDFQSPLQTDLQIDSNVNISTDVKGGTITENFLNNITSISTDIKGGIITKQLNNLTSIKTSIMYEQFSKVVCRKIKCERDAPNCVAQGIDYISIKSMSCCQCLNGLELVYYQLSKLSNIATIVLRGYKVDPCLLNREDLDAIPPLQNLLGAWDSIRITDSLCYIGFNAYDIANENTDPPDYE